MRGALDSFAAISSDDIQAMAANLTYTSGLIDDLVNIGLNYLVRVGDVSTFPASANNTFTIRITPTRDTSLTAAPTYVGQIPDPLLLYTSSDASVLLQPEPTFAIGSLLTARVGDADLNQDTTVAEEGSEFTADFTNLKVNGKLRISFDWTAKQEDGAFPRPAYGFYYSD